MKIYLKKYDMTFGGKTKKRILDYLAKIERPACLIELMLAFPDLSRKAIKACLKNLAIRGLIRIEKDGFERIPFKALNPLLKGRVKKSELQLSKSLGEKFLALGVLREVKILNQEFYELTDKGKSLLLRDENPYIQAKVS